MRMLPIVALVTEDTFHALNDHIGTLPVEPRVEDLLEQHPGWTIDALVAGVILRQALLP